MKKYFFNLIAGFIALSTALVLTACETDESVSNGRVQLFLTDAPIDADDVSGVYITITRIEYQKQGEPWQTLEDFEGPQTINLLDLQNGETQFLGEFSAGAGTYNGFRFFLDAPERNGGAQSNPGTYIQYTNGEQKPLFVPSGAQTGYKTIGEFNVPANGNVQVIADFDVRKSVVKAGNSGMYILKPTIRIIVENQSGQIEGNVAPREEELSYVVYSYAANTYNDDEAIENEDGGMFVNAISSARVDDLGDYLLPFLASGTYDLVVATSLDGEFVEVVKIATGVTVNSNETTRRDIDLTLQEDQEDEEDSEDEEEEEEEEDDEEEGGEDEEDGEDDDEEDEGGE
jgi:hypothetical protein